MNVLNVKIVSIGLTLQIYPHFAANTDYSSFDTGDGIPNHRTIYM